MYIYRQKDRWCWRFLPRFLLIVFSFYIAIFFFFLIKFLLYFFLYFFFWLILSSCLISKQIHAVQTAEQCYRCCEKYRKRSRTFPPTLYISLMIFVRYIGPSQSFYCLVLVEKRWAQQQQQHFICHLVWLLLFVTFIFPLFFFFHYSSCIHALVFSVQKFPWFQNL